jgi:hypothetical protein
MYPDFGQLLNSSYRVAKTTPCAAFAMIAATDCGFET